MWQTKYAAATPKNLGLGLNFWPCSEGCSPSGRPQSVLWQVYKNMNAPLVKLLIHFERQTQQRDMYFHCQINVWSLSDPMTIDSLRCYAIHNFRCLECLVLFIPSIPNTLFSGTTPGQVICWTLLQRLAYSNFYGT